MWGSENEPFTVTPDFIAAEIHLESVIDKGQASEINRQRDGTICFFALQQEFMLVHLSQSHSGPAPANSDSDLTIPQSTPPRQRDPYPRGKARSLFKRDHCAVRFFISRKRKLVIHQNQGGEQLHFEHQLTLSPTRSFSHISSRTDVCFSQAVSVMFNKFTFATDPDLYKHVTSRGGRFFIQRHASLN